jgi:hypothetical protein
MSVFGLAAALVMGAWTVEDVQGDRRVTAIAEHCKLGPYFLRIDGRKRVTIQVPPNVRARPLNDRHLDCVRSRLKSIPGARLVTGMIVPESRADLQSMLGAIHRDCALGPYQLRAISRSSAVITIEPTMRVRPLTRRQHHCAKTAVERIPGVKLGRGIAPTVD